LLSQRLQSHRKTFLSRLRPTKRRRKRPNNINQEPLEDHYNENYEEDPFEDNPQGGNEEPSTRASVSDASTSENHSSPPSYRENAYVNISTITENVEVYSDFEETKV